MDNPFFEHPIFNSPDIYPTRHGKLDDQGHSTRKIIQSRRRAEFITPIRQTDTRHCPIKGTILDIDCKEEFCRVVEIKGYRCEDAKEKKATMETCRIPGVNHLSSYGRWAFAEFSDAHRMEADFEARIEAELNRIINQCSTGRR
ncbi:hypothetical protein SAMN04489760_12512 [Syntrophus gentianae]|uniref:Uncharacterized protein n=1 Tax=Syntrophus gentianae TaxID=43775 RepID=A0A1H7ZNG5_9BACT|nr:hypothetical protein [Syntrophus gentianae]SEM59464.1 hypothetical protein SAMN04489760_12512 [Syntrophus gentianae]